MIRRPPRSTLFPYRRSSDLHPTTTEDLFGNAAPRRTCSRLERLLVPFTCGRNHGGKPDETVIAATQSLSCGGTPLDPHGGFLRRCGSGDPEVWRSSPPRLPPLR